MDKPDSKPSYSLDDESVRALDALAQRWKVSRSEALRRAIQIMSGRPASSSSEALDALDRLQASLAERKVDLARWEREVRAERHGTES